MTWIKILSPRDVLHFLALSIGPAAAYALLADPLLPSAWGSAAPRNFATVIALIVLISVVLQILVACRRKIIIAEIRESVERLAKGQLVIRAHQHRGSLGTLAVSINRLADAMEESSGVHGKKVGVLNSELSTAKSQIQSRSLFLANLSCELRGRLNGIMGLAYLARDTDSMSEALQFVESIIGSSQALLDNLSDLSDFSSVEAGRIKVAKELFGLHLAIKSTIAKHVFPAHRKGLKLRCKIATNVPYKALGDDQRFRQVLSNFLDNAIKYTEDGVISVLATVGRESLSLATVRIAVTDTGQGIGHEEQADLFRDVYSDQALDAQTCPWTGVGLAMCSDLAEMMGGTVGAESEKGVGSSFWFSVTVDKVTDVATPTPRPDERSRKSQPIMVVTEDPDRAVEVMLEVKQLGFVSQLQDDRAEFGDRLRESSCGLVLLDGEPPQLIATLAAWHPDGTASQVPVVGIPINSDGSLDRQRLGGLVLDWMGEEEDITAEHGSVPV